MGCLCSKECDEPQSPVVQRRQTLIQQRNVPEAILINHQEDIVQERRATATQRQIPIINSQQQISDFNRSERRKLANLQPKLVEVKPQSVRIQPKAVPPVDFPSKPVKIALNASLLKILNPNLEPFNVRYTLLSEYDFEYQRIDNMVTNKRAFKVNRIERIDNPVLRKAYELKKQAKLLQFPHLQERLLFHGTKHANVNDICEYNFDWRRGVRHKFGRGVSFSPKATYAANYSDEFRYDKLMIVAFVLIGKSCFGQENLQLPPEGFDTTHKGDGIVTVKYEDNEFYPAYKMTYHWVRQPRPQQRYNRRY